MKLTSLKAGSKVYDYTLTKKLGQGSSGFVWVAKDGADEEFVLKLVPLEGWRKDEYERELTALEKLKHPNILKLYNHYEDGKEGILVIEKLDRDLLEFLDDYQITENEARLIFNQILYAINHFHKNNCAHMDIKPENILIRGTNRIKIADLGSTYIWENEEGRHKTGKAGTSFYCAPEVKDSSSPYLADKADIWSLGITLHVILTGFWPYLGQTEKEVLSNAKIGKVDLAYQLLSESVCDLLQKMSKIEPSERVPIDELLTHTWFSEGEIGDLIFTPREGAATPKLQLTLPEGVGGEEGENANSLSDLNQEGFKTPRKCQMFSPRAELDGINIDDELGIRPSPRVAPLEVDAKGSKPTKLRKFLLNFRRLNKKKEEKEKK